MCSLQVRFSAVLFNGMVLNVCKRIYLASSSKTPEALFSALNASGLPDSADAHEFINQVFQQAPRKHKHKRTAAEKAQRQAEKEAKALRSQKFGLLLEDDGVVPLPKEKRQKEKKHDRQTRKREYDEKEWESDEEERPGSGGKAMMPRSRRISNRNFRRMRRLGGSENVWRI